MPDTIVLTPLPKGMAATLGNFVRRSIYCLRTRWTILGFRLNNLHEFDTLPNSTDVMSDIMVKLVDLRFRLKPELQELLERPDFKRGTEESRTVQLPPNLSHINTIVTESQQVVPVFSLSLKEHTDVLSTDILNQWLDIENPSVLARTLNPQSFSLQLFLAPIMGTLTTDETFIYNPSEMICLPSPSRMDLEVLYSYTENFGYDTLTLEVRPNTPQNLQEVRGCIVKACTFLSAVLH